MIKSAKLFDEIRHFQGVFVSAQPAPADQTHHQGASAPLQGVQGQTRAPHSNQQNISQVHQLVSQVSQSVRSFSQVSETINKITPLLNFDKFSNKLQFDYYSFRQSFKVSFDNSASLHIDHSVIQLTSQTVSQAVR